MYGNQGSEKLSTLLKVTQITQLGSNGVGI